MALSTITLTYPALSPRAGTVSSSGLYAVWYTSILSAPSCFSASSSARPQHPYSSGVNTCRQRRVSAGGHFLSKRSEMTSRILTESQSLGQPSGGSRACSRAPAAALAGDGAQREGAPSRPKGCLCAQRGASLCELVPLCNVVCRGRAHRGRDVEVVHRGRATREDAPRERYPSLDRTPARRHRAHSRYHRPPVRESTLRVNLSSSGDEESEIPKTKSPYTSPRRTWMATGVSSG